MAPTSPYTTQEAVSYLLINLFKGGAPTVSTTPDSTKAAQAITWAASWLEMTYADVGYVIPFQDLTGETWPAHQTMYLSMVNAIGAAGFIGGHMLRPAPSIGPGKGQQFSNLYQELFDRELTAVKESKGKMFRAAYYVGTDAEQRLATPMGPRLDYTEGYYDPTRFAGIWGLTEIFDEFRVDIEELDLDWDYMYSLRTA